MALLEIENLKFNYSDKELYKDVCLKLNNGEHATLVGVNGSGKSTLFRLILGTLSPDEGKVSWEKNVTYSYLDQQLEVKQDMTVIEYMYDAYSDLFEKEKHLENLYAQIANTPDNYEELLNKATHIQDELTYSPFYSIQETVNKLLTGLGFPQDHLDHKLSELSGGQREKIYLSKMLLESRDVLLMDEPTNFLDANQVDWLANYLINYPKTFLVISHDQEFLKKIANVVFVLENKTITRYKGDFAHYLTQHEIDKEQYAKNYEAQQRYIKKEEDFIAAHIVRATSSKAAKSRRARLAHLERLDEPGKDEGNVHFSFPYYKEIGDIQLKVEGLTIGYDNPLVSNISFLLKKGQKIAILGRNGIGKTTFIKTILNELVELDGKYHWQEGVIVNYLSQNDDFDKNISPFDLLHNQYPNLTNTDIRKILGNVGVKKELALRPLKELSGGEVTKARIGLMLLKKSNFLILDEPTNHLDQKAKDALFDAIERFEGCVIIVSHEKDFYDGLVDFELKF